MKREKSATRVAAFLIATALANLPALAREPHFGKSQSEATITLPAGKHTLLLVLGESLHMPHEPAIVSRKITITVE